ncbi:hypothetical protein GCM10010289_83780 [Streptomyces violascens]|uniref:Uncharacterized protein n=1 Tax=Streptomyces violascens TaxID=67381 RepID=A0ABQ3QSG1_9ACTN|nr:hypothetical protein GCM10010289_83780 [Streptomyces violascens]GHI40187.1 hypothetical protein Sviol_45950 [Streptomyces violascens]
MKTGAPVVPQVIVTDPVRAARRVTRLAPSWPVAVEVIVASIGLLACGAGQEPLGRGSRTTVTVEPGRTHSRRTAAFALPWVIVTAPEAQPGDAEPVPSPAPAAVGLVVGGLDGGPADADGLACVVPGGEAAGLGMPRSLPDVAAEDAPEEESCGAEPACELLPLSPHALRKQDTATRTTPSQDRLGPCPWLFVAGAAVTTSSLRPRTAL